MSRSWVKPVITWVWLAAALHSIWELAQLPFYSLWNDPDRVRMALYVIHCIIGDVLIATVLFLLVAAAMRSFGWPSVRPWAGGVLFITAGLVYTAFSEWYNVYQTRAWAYTPEMLLIGGIGIAPLLQWLVVPFLMILAIRRISPP